MMSAFLLRYHSSLVSTIAETGSVISTSWSKRERKSGTTFNEPFRYCISKSYFESFKDQFASPLVGSLRDLNYFKLW